MHSADVVLGLTRRLHIDDDYDDGDSAEEEAAGEEEEEAVGEEEEEDKPMFVISGPQEIYSSGQADTIDMNYKPSKFKSIRPLHRLCQHRLSAVIRASRVHFRCFDPKDQVIRYVRKSIVARQLNELQKKIERLEGRNIALLMTPPPRPPTAMKRMREMKRLLTEVHVAERRIEIMRDANRDREGEVRRTIFDFDDEVAQVKVHYQVKITKEKAMIEAMNGDIDEIQRELESVEKRIALMNRRESVYSELFANSAVPSAVASAVPSAPKSASRKERAEGDKEAMRELELE